MVTDGRGIPLAARLTEANRHDVTQLLPLVEAIPPIRGKVGHPRRRPDRVQGDRAYDSAPHRHALRRLGILPILAQRRTAHGSGLGVFRWVVERTFAGCISSGACGSAMNDGPISMRRSSPSGAA